jgi:predicted RNase H-like nuclease (RuvC/YqgF family)
MINDLDHLLAQTQVSAIITSLDTELSRIKQLNKPKHEPFKIGTQKHLESMREVLLHLMICEKELRTLLSVNYNLHRENMELSRKVEQLENTNTHLINGI